MQVSEVLYGAADHIAVFGLCKNRLHGNIHNPQGASACALGAIDVAAGLTGIDGWLPASMALQRHLGGDIALWNNTPERTAAEVIATLRAAAVIEAAKEQAAVDTPAVSVAPVRSGL